MLCSECVIMRKDRDNPLALSSKKPCQGQTDSRRELERLRADSEAEETRTQQAHGNLCVEVRHPQEEVDKEKHRAVRELTARRGCPKDRYSHRHWRLPPRETNVKESGRYREVEPTGKGSFCLYSGETYATLEHLLLTLYEKINGEQPVYKLHHRQDLELEKAIFLCHLLKTHGRLLQGRQRAGHPSWLSRKPTQEDSNSCLREPLLTHSSSLLQRSHSASKVTTKQAQQELPLRRAPRAADPWTTAAVVDTCQSSSLKICCPPKTLHAGRDNQPPCCAESSSGSEKSPPSKCRDRNMEVSYVSFQHFILSVYAYRFCWPWGRSCTLWSPEEVLTMSCNLSYPFLIRLFHVILYKINLAVGRKCVRIRTKLVLVDVHFIFWQNLEFWSWKPHTRHAATILCASVNLRPQAQTEEDISIQIIPYCYSAGY